MKHFLLKFNHGVEIGAKLAYLGHFKRTGEAGIYKIIEDETEHRESIRLMLLELGELPSKPIDRLFTVVGSVIQFFCLFCPLWTLDLVARSMEAFAVVNYTKLAKIYPSKALQFTKMAQAEENHKLYFTLGPVQYQNLMNLRSAIAGGNYNSPRYYGYEDENPFDPDRS